MRIVIYARKSTESEDRQVQSLEDQVRALREVAGREGWVVSEVIQESRSAKVPHNRPEFSRLMADVESGRVRGILTWSINRLSRNALDGGQVAYLLQSGRLDFIRTIERIYRPDDNALLMSIENGMAIAYIQDLARNVARGMRGKAERGWCPYKAPIGYRNDAESREVVIDTDRWGVVRRGWEMALQGQGLTEIHEYFRSYRLTIRSKRGGREVLSRAAVHKVFCNPFYMGLVPYKGTLLPGAHIPMVTAEEFERARERLARRSNNKKPLRKLFPYSGLMTCSCCGSAIVGEEKRKKLSDGSTAIYIYYHCSGSKGCSRKSIRAENLHQQAADLVQKIAIPRSFATWLREAMTSLSESELPDRANRASGLNDEQKKLEARLKRLTTLRLDEEISSEEFSQARLDILEQQDRLRAVKNMELDREAQILRALRPRLDAAVAAGELSGKADDPKVIAQVLRVAGNFQLASDGSRFIPDPILAKIASFEPLRDGSEKPKPGDFLPADSLWWALVEDIRTTLYGLKTQNGYRHAAYASVKGSKRKISGGVSSWSSVGGTVR